MDTITDAFAARYGRLKKYSGLSSQHAVGTDVRTGQAR